MDRETAIQKLRECQKLDDVEVAHVDADQVLCDLLSDLGYADVVSEYVEVDKYYV